MLSLVAFQRDFAAALRAATVAEPAALTIHRNTGARAAIDALAANYPVVHALFGEEPFTACAQAYLQVSPPCEPRLSHVGAGFAMFLRSYPPVQDILWIADVAALERLWLESLFSADAAILDGAALLQLGVDDETRLVLHPATRFAPFASPAVSIWHAHASEDPNALEMIEWGPETALVTRPGQAVQIDAVGPGGLAFLNAIAIGQPLVGAGAAAFDADPEVDLQTLFARLMESGAFTHTPSDRSPS